METHPVLAEQAKQRFARIVIIDPCTCPKPETPPCPECGEKPCVCRETIEIRLSDGKVRQIRHISSVMYWDAKGTPITAKEFVERMFGDLPQFFEDEDQLWIIWSYPDTREKLLADLSDAGYDKEKLESMKALIDAKDSDVYDVLAYVAYAKETQSREARATSAKPSINSNFTDYKQQESSFALLSITT